jgi:hypothetical protein
VRDVGENTTTEISVPASSWTKVKGDVTFEVLTAMKIEVMGFFWSTLL